VQAFTTHTGRAVPLRRSDVDTDQIIPSDWLKRVERTGFGAGLFSEADPALEVTVDLGARELRAGPLVATFPLDDFTRWRLMEGLDDIGLTLRNEADIAAYEGVRPSYLPSTTVGA
jgi:3-isopropylmalate/(R)-2-methylmalate dehydratase small subunit